jgi:hypothetical protein
MEKDPWPSNGAEAHESSARTGNVQALVRTGVPTRPDHGSGPSLRGRHIETDEGRNVPKTHWLVASHRK